MSTPRTLLVFDKGQRGPGDSDLGVDLSIRGDKLAMGGEGELIELAAGWFYPVLRLTHGLVSLRMVWSHLGRWPGWVSLSLMLYTGT